LVDVYKKQAYSISFLNYLLSISFFAQLPSGPIFTYKKIAPQFKMFGKFVVDCVIIYSGGSLFVFGLFKKIFFADPLGNAIDSLYFNLNQGGALTFEESVFTTWGFLLQLYFDFSAYSDMAIGIGLCLGLKFPINFNSPFKATSLGDYILRWHMSLINFTRDYVFLSVSKGVRKISVGSAVKKQLMGWVFGIFAAYIVIAIWHTPSVDSLISGILIGVIVIAVQLGGQYFLPKRKKKYPSQIQILLNRGFLLVVASLAAAALRLDSFVRIGELIAGFGILFFQSSLEVSIDVLFFGFESLRFPLLLFILIATLIVFYLPNTMELFGLIHVEKEKWYSKYLWKPNLIWGVLMGLFLAFYFIFCYRDVQGFMYEKF